MKDDIVYLVHILECIRRIEEDLAEGQERFMASHMEWHLPIQRLNSNPLKKLTNRKAFSSLAWAKKDRQCGPLGKNSYASGERHSALPDLCLNTTL
jgi:hypothetical protein